MPERCTGRNKDASSCNAQVWRDGLCRWHHPDLEEQRAAERSLGGKARSNAARAAKRLPDGVMTTQELQGVLGTTIHDALAGRVEAGVANAVANLARAYVTVGEASTLERLEARLDELERLAQGRTA